MEPKSSPFASFLSNINEKLKNAWKGCAPACGLITRSHTDSDKSLMWAGTRRQRDGEAVQSISRPAAETEKLASRYPAVITARPDPAGGHLAGQTR